MHIVSVVLALLVLTGAEPASAAFTALPAAPRCATYIRVQEIQQLDCNSLAHVNQFGGCSGFCRDFAQAWGSASEAAIAQCIDNCNNQLARCSGGGGGGQPNCQWYSKGEIRKYICRVY